MRDIKERQDSIEYEKIQYDQMVKKKDNEINLLK